MRDLFAEHKQRHTSFHKGQFVSVDCSFCFGRIMDENQRFSAALEKIKSEYERAWDYAKRHPDNAGLGIPTIGRAIDEALAPREAAESSEASSKGTEENEEEICPGCGDLPCHCPV